jgi:subtilisin family serine protease
VAATDSVDSRALWSNYGTWIDVSAPGAGIYTTVRGGTYGSASGTSFASPITAAVAALMLAAQPNLSADQLTSLLRSSAVDLGTSGFDSTFGWGRVDANRAVQAAQTAVVGQSTTEPPDTGSTEPVSPAPPGKKKKGGR